MLPVSFADTAPKPIGGNEVGLVYGFETKPEGLIEIARTIDADLVDDEWISAIDQEFTRVLHETNRWTKAASIALHVVDPSYYQRESKNIMLGIKYPLKNKYFNFESLMRIEGNLTPGSVWEKEFGTIYEDGDPMPDENWDKLFYSLHIYDLEHLLDLKDLLNLMYEHAAIGDHGDAGPVVNAII